MKFKAKTAHNPDGYGLFLTQKFAKKMIFRTLLLCLVVALSLLIFLFSCNISIYYKQCSNRPYNKAAYTKKIKTDINAYQSN